MFNVIDVIEPTKTTADREVSDELSILTMTYAIEVMAKWMVGIIRIISFSISMARAIVDARETGNIVLILKICCVDCRIFIFFSNFQLRI